MWIDGNSVGLGCVGFTKDQTKQNSRQAEAACKQKNSQAHLIEISSEEQQKFLMESKVLKKVKDVVGHQNANWWIGAELIRGTWSWTKSKTPVSYVPKIGNGGSFDKRYSYAVMYLSKNSAYWYDDKGTKYYVMPLCQISQAGDYSETESKKAGETESKKSGE